MNGNPLSRHKTTQTPSALAAWTNVRFLTVNAKICSDGTNFQNIRVFTLEIGFSERKVRISMFNSWDLAMQLRSVHASGSPLDSTFLHLLENSDKLSKLNVCHSLPALPASEVVSLALLWWNGASSRMLASIASIFSRFSSSEVCEVRDDYPLWASGGMLLPPQGWSATPSGMALSSDCAVLRLCAVSVSVLSCAVPRLAAGLPGSAARGHRGKTMAALRGMWEALRSGSIGSLRSVPRIHGTMPKPFA